jgi:hypothetical protein
MTTSWAIWAVLIFNGGPFLLIAIGVMYNFYLNYRHLDALINALKNSPFSYTWAPILRAQGWIGSMLVIAKISGMILMPNISMRMGHLSPVDFHNFPPYLKRQLKIVTWLMLGGGFWLAATAMLDIKITR